MRYRRTSDARPYGLSCHCEERSDAAIRFLAPSGRGLRPQGGGGENKILFSPSVTCGDTSLIRGRLSLAADRHGPWASQ